MKAGSWFNHSCDPTAVVSFLGRMLRVHVLRDLGEGEEVSVSYVELYAGRAARQAALRAKKGFACVCLRCETPPATDAALEGWQCTGQVGCQSGCVPPGATACTSCGTAHKLAPAARAAVEDRWRQSLDEWSSALLGGRSAKPIRELARELLPSIETFLRSDSADRLCEAHALRQRAFVLRSYAFAAAGAPPDCLRMPSSAASMGWQRTSTRPSHTSSSFTSGSAQRSRGKPKWSSPQATSTRRPRRGSERARWALLRRRAWR